MARSSAVRKHTTKGRTPWYTLTLAGKDHHLGTDPSEAYRKAAVLLEQSGRDPDGAPGTVYGLCVAYERHYPKTHNALRLWQSLQGGIPLADLTTEHLDAYISAIKKGRQQNTVRLYSGQVITALRFAKRKKWVNQVPDSPKRPAASRKPRDLSDEQLQAGFARMMPHTKRIVGFLLAVGCRPGEAAALRWKHLRLDQGVAILGEHKTGEKTGKVRTIYLTPPAVEILKALPKGGREDPVFRNGNGEAYTAATLTEVARRAGWGGMYTARHTFAQRVSEQTDVQNLSKLMGHSSVNMTAFYYQVKNERAKQIANSVTLPRLPDLK